MGWGGGSKAGVGDAREFEFGAAGMGSTKVGVARRLSGGLL